MMKWGIIGAGNIAKRFAESLSFEENAELYAISGRNEEKLQAFRKEHPCKKIYLSHNELLDDQEIDAVYIALPHHMHKEWIIKSLEKSKAVLCEKPACMNEEEALEIQKCAHENHTLFMEAMKARFQPASEYMRNQINAGVIGDIESLEIHYSFLLPKEMYGKTYHTQKEAGGCLLDVGIYGISYLEEFMTGEPKLLHTDANFYRDIEIYLDSEMEFENGMARMLIGFDRNEEPTAVIKGTKGTMVVHHIQRPDEIEIIRPGKPEIRRVFDYEHDDFYGEIHHFDQLILEGKTESLIMPISDTVREFHIMDQIRKGFTEYTEEDLKMIEEEELYLRYETFDNEDARTLGNQIAELAKHYDRGISISIIRELDQLEVYRYFMNDKNASNEKWMAMKRDAVLQSGHSSVWTWVNAKLAKPHECHVVMSGGAFPICLKDGTHVYTVSVSGLHEGKDHQLVITALEKILDMKLPEFNKALA